MEDCELIKLLSLSGNPCLPIPLQGGQQNDTQPGKKQGWPPRRIAMRRDLVLQPVATRELTRKWGHLQGIRLIGTHASTGIGGEGFAFLPAGLAPQYKQCAQMNGTVGASRIAWRGPTDHLELQAASRDVTADEGTNKDVTACVVGCCHASLELWEVTSQRRSKPVCEVRFDRGLGRESPASEVVREARGRACICSGSGPARA